MRPEPVQNCTRLQTEEAAYIEAAELADQVINAAIPATGSVDRAITFIANHYAVAPSWLERLWKRRRAPIHAHFVNNLIVALEDGVRRQEKAILLQKARLDAVNSSRASLSSLAREPVPALVSGVAPAVI